MILTNKAQDPIAHLILAHGAGAGMHSEFMVRVAEFFAQRGITVTRFDFEYMQKAGALNRRQPPDRMPKLQAYFSLIIAELDASLPLFIGGKSMGGRVASMWYREVAIHLAPKKKWQPMICLAPFERIFCLMAITV